MMASQCAAENVDHPEYLLRLAELELIDRHQRMAGAADPRGPFPCRRRTWTPSTSRPCPR